MIETIESSPIFVHHITSSTFVIPQEKFPMINVMNHFLIYIMVLKQHIVKRLQDIILTFLAITIGLESLVQKSSLDIFSVGKRKIYLFSEFHIGNLIY